jgi:hypothetical protein
MSSEQLKAFDVSLEPQAVHRLYGDTPFGRGCLAARRLIEAGVRCVEVTLSGWDTHVNNHELQGKQIAILDPAFAALIRDLRERRLFDRTVVLCAGEFGRTPKVNPAGGRDHWPRHRLRQNEPDTARPDRPHQRRQAGEGASLVTHRSRAVVIGGPTVREGEPGPP